MRNWTKEGISTEDRISYAFNLLNGFMGENQQLMTKQQYWELCQVLAVLSENPITDEDRQWADRELRKLFGENNNG